MSDDRAAESARHCEPGVPSKEGSRNSIALTARARQRRSPVEARSALSGADPGLFRRLKWVVRFNSNVSNSALSFRVAHQRFVDGCALDLHTLARMVDGRPPNCRFGNGPHRPGPRQLTNPFSVSLTRQRP